MRLGLVVVGIVMASALAAWGLVAGYRIVDRRAAAAVTTTDAEVAILWPALAGGDGTWLPKTEQQRLLVSAQRALGAPTRQLTAQPLERVALAMERTGWFVGTPRVRREGVAGVRVQGQWRTPAAVVRSGNSDYLVSSDGLCMPVVYPAGQSGGALPVVLGVADTPPTRTEGLVDFHTPWAGGDMKAALALINLLNRESFWPEVAGVDVSAVRRGGKIELISARGGAIVWGGAPGAFSPTEQPDEVKIARLRHFALHEGGIDAGRERLEIFGPQVVLDRSAFAAGP